MARSRKRTPITAITGAPSDKPFKQAEHRRKRAAVRDALKKGEDPPGEKLFGNPWSGLKDGKHYAPDRPDILRK